MKRQWFAFGVFTLVFMLVALPSVFADGPVTGRAGRAEVRFLEGMIDHHQTSLDLANDSLKKAKTESVRKLAQTIIDAQSTEIKIMRGWLLSWYQLDYTPRSSVDTSMSMMPMMKMMMSMMDSNDMGMGGTMGQSGSGQQTPDMGGMMGQDGSKDKAPDMGGMTGQNGNGDKTPKGSGMSMMPMMEMMMSMMHGTDMGMGGMATGVMGSLSKLEGHEYEVAWLETMSDHDAEAVSMAERILTYAENKPLRDMAQKIIAGQKAEISTIESLITELSASKTQ